MRALTCVWSVNSVEVEVGMAGSVSLVMFFCCRALLVCRFVAYNKPSKSTREQSYIVVGAQHCWWSLPNMTSVT